MADRVYCYPGTDVLMNKLGIRDKNKLQDYERRLTMLRLLELTEKPIHGNFDLSHLKKIHQYIFQDIYEWAGEIRQVDIAKTYMFCNVKFIETQSEEIFGKLKEEKFLSNLEISKFIPRLAYYFAEVNALHPFREGNGRTQREFFRTLADQNGYILSFANISEEEMIQISQESFLLKYDGLEQMFWKCLRKK